MPRRNAATKRSVIPDARYNDKTVSQLINKIMKDGKKSLAERIVYGAFDIIEQNTGDKPMTVFKKAMENIKPQVECRPRRVGGATYQVPMEVNPRRSETLAIRWLVSFSRGRREHTMERRLASEIMDAAQNTGGAVKRREDMFRMAESNRAFSHYRF